MASYAHLNDTPAAMALQDYEEGFTEIVIQGVLCGACKLQLPVHTPLLTLWLLLAHHPRPPDPSFSRLQ